MTVIACDAINHIESNAGRGDSRLEVRWTAPSLLRTISTGVSNVAIQVGAPGEAGVVPGVDAGGVGLKAEVACGAIHEPRVARANPAVIQ
jgi:hypothetical protein